MGMFDKDDEPDWDKLINERDKKIKEMDVIIARLQVPYCLGKTTIQEVAEHLEFEVAGKHFIAASDLCKKDPYKRIEELEGTLVCIQEVARTSTDTSAYGLIVQTAQRTLDRKLQP